jgi:tetratricopeptide (TPR) repeat protein
LGKLAQSLGKLDEAEGYFLDSLQLVDNDFEAQGYRHQNLGSLYLLKKDSKKAELSFHAALNAFQQAGKVEKSGEIFEILGFLREIEGETAEAEECYLKALENFTHCESKKGKGEVYRTLGLLYEQDGKDKKALENLWQALNLYRETEHMDAPQVEREIQRISRRIRRG